MHFSGLFIFYWLWRLMRFSGFHIGQGKSFLKKSLIIHMIVKHAHLLV